MIKVLHKALNIIEFLAKYPNGKSLSEIAEFLGENLTTTSNIVKVLAKRNYLEKIGKRWRLGIAAYMLTSATREYNKMLCDLAEPIIKKLSVITGSLVTLSIWENNERYVLLRIGDKSKMPRSGCLPEKGKVLKTISGRVLLAYQSEEVIEEYIAKNRVVDGKIMTDEQIEEFKDSLTLIRSKGYYARENGNVFEATVPIFDADGGVKTAVGIYDMPLDDVQSVEKTVRYVQKAADEIEKALRSIEGIHK